MILDYKNNREFVLENGVIPENTIGETHFVVEKVVKNVTFRNFSHLCIEDAYFENCVFENCKCVSAESCQMKSCTFNNVDSIEGIRADFTDCEFNSCCSNGPLLVINSHGCVKGCTFDTITTLGDDGYIIYSVYGKKSDVEIVSGCRFLDCRVESEDGNFCYCAYFKPFSSYNTVKIDNVDYDTCEGLV